MRELPEIEVLRRDLEREYVGKRFKGVEAPSMQALARYRTRKQFADQLVGHKIKAVQRFGTLLVFNLDGTDALVMDLGSSGLLLKAKSARSAEPDGTVATFSLGAGGPLRLVDESGAAEAFVVPMEDLEAEVPEISELGIDPVTEPISWQAFGILLQRHTGKLRPLLLDRTFIAGIGPLYADEILFTAGLRHDRDVASLTTQEIRRLFRAVVEVLQDALKYRGSSFEDDAFVDLFGEAGTYQERLQVFGKAGEPCPRCRKPIEKARVGRGVTYFSPSQV